MQLYLLRNTELRMIVLPQKVSGQQMIEYTADNSELRPLLRVNAGEDGWYITENRQIRINTVPSEENAVFRSFKLKENSLHYLRRENRETMVLLVEPDREGSRRYSHYMVPAGGVIEVGQAEFNQIQYKHPYINDKTHLRIYYQGDGLIRVSDCEEGIPDNRKSRAYLNNEPVLTERSARIGDVIFLLGLKIVLGPGFIAVNHPEQPVHVRLERRDYVRFVPAELEEASEATEEEQKHFSSAPRARREIIHRAFKIEKPPEGLQEADTPWIVMLGPSLTMAMGSVFSSVITLNNILASSGNINSALPSLVTSLVMVMGSAVWPIIGRRVQHRSQVRKAAIASDDYEQYLNGLKADIENAIKQQKEILEENNPALENCIRTILNTSETLWERSQRHKDFLDVMIGRGTLPLDAEFSYPERGYHSEISESARSMYQLVAKDHSIDDVPVTVPLKGTGIVGVVGDRSETISFVKALLLELTSMHNYEDLKIIFIYNEKERKIWNFVKWIPHIWNDERTVRYLANDADEVRNLSDAISNLRSVQRHSGRKENDGPYYLIFAADKQLAEHAQAIKEFYQHPDDANMTMVALFDERQYLPKTCSYVIDLTHDADRKSTSESPKVVAATLSDYNDITGRSIVCSERIGYDGDPEDIFIHMANIRLDSPTASKQLPAQYTFMEMYEAGMAEYLDPIRRWREHNAVDSLSVPIGVDEDGYLISLDIHEKAHGPHGLIAGMTGSGKSEFIISYIASLAVNYSPEDVAFVLIDFKGGGMADIFKTLPHTAGLITNLDGNELKRSFLAIEHELEKRQKPFKEISDRKKISNIDIYKYQKLRGEDSSLTPLPHLVIISDEFAELKQQHGDFMGQLIRIARIGRSLGVHLILATQKPDGVVDEQIKSNIRFKVCLKVQDKADSQGMIGRPVATLITNPGRFYFQVGNDEVFEYGQSPWPGALYEPMEHVRKNDCDYIEVLNEQGRVICRESVPKGKRDKSLPEKQIDALVQYISETAEQNHMKAEKLWLDPLSPPKAEKKKTTVYETEIRPFVLNPTIGLYDDLLNQKHLPLTIPFSTEGNALLYGASGSGKLEFLNSMLVALMERHSPEELSVYLCDYDAGSLFAFADAPHTKMVTGAGERAETERMLDELIYHLTERRELLRKYGGDYQTYVHTSGNSVPNLLLVAHNFQNLTDDYPDARPKLVRLAREGVKYGIYLMVTGTAANSIPHSMQPLFRNVYTLRQNTDDQYRELVGKTGGITPEQYRGRGLVRADGVVCEFQTKLVFEDAENKYEAIQAFCRNLAAKYTKKEAFSVQAEQKRQKKEAAPAALELAAHDCTLDSLPLACAVQDGSLLSYNLTKAASTVIIYDDIHMRAKDWVLSAVQCAHPDQILLEDTAKTEQTVAAIDALWAKMLQRGTAGQDAMKRGEPVPDFEPLVVHIRHPGKITPTLPDVQRGRLVAMIQKLSPVYHIYFVIEEHVSEMNVLLSGICLEAAVPFSQGIVLTTDISAYLAFADEVTFSGRAAAPRGFLVQDGKATLGEMIER